MCIDRREPQTIGKSTATTTHRQTDRHARSVQKVDDHWDTHTRRTNRKYHVMLMVMIGGFGSSVVSACVWTNLRAVALRFVVVLLQHVPIAIQSTCITYKYMTLKLKQYL